MLGGITLASCNNNWAVWNVGSRTQWNIDSQTYIGVDVVYQALQSATGTNAAGTGVVVAAGGNQPAALRYALRSERVHGSVPRAS